MEKGTLVKSPITWGIERVGIVIGGPKLRSGKDQWEGDEYKICWQDHPTFKVISTIPCIEWKHQADLEIISLPNRDGQG